MARGRKDSTSQDALDPQHGLSSSLSQASQRPSAERTLSKPSGRQKCCRCNGVNARCTFCACAKANRACTDCLPSKHSCCQNVSSYLTTSSNAPTDSPSKKNYRILSRISKNLIRTSFLIRKRVRNNKRRKILKPYKIPTRFLQEMYRNV